MGGTEVWRARVRGPVDGEPASAAVLGRPLDDLAARDEFLRGLYEAAELGSALSLRDVPLSAAVEAEDVVYWDAEAGVFDRALAACEVDAATRALVPAKTAQVRGVLAARTGTGVGTVIALGLLPARPRVNPGHGAADGRYYLSAADPGKLTLQRPPVGVPVLELAGDYAFVAPSANRFLESHLHYAVDLVCQPCGEESVAGDTVSIAYVDALVAGWLPADHASFNGKAPAGAKFGYNLDQHPSLKALFPPAPVEACQLVWDRGADPAAGGTFVRLGASGTCVIDENGIWWMLDGVGQVPWTNGSGGQFPGTLAPPRLFAPTLFAPRLLGAPDPSLPSGSVDSTMRMTLAFATSLFATNRAAVTSLRPRPGSPVSITDCDGNPASAGPLLVDFDLDLLPAEESDTAGAVVFKGLDGKTLTRGPVVEWIQSASPGLAVTSSIHSGTGADTRHQGGLVLNLVSDLQGRELDPQIIDLQGAVIERTHAGVPFLSFPPARATELSLAFRVPLTGLPPTPNITLALWVLGSTAGTLPDLDATYALLSDPGTSTSTLPSSFLDLDLTVAGAVSAWQYRRFDSETVALPAGGLLIVTIARAADDGYTGEVGLLRCAAVLGDGGAV